MCGCNGKSQSTSGIGAPQGTNKAGQQCIPVGFEVLFTGKTGGVRVLRYLTQSEADAAAKSPGAQGTPIPVCK